MKKYRTRTILLILGILLIIYLKYINKKPITKESNNSSDVYLSLPPCISISCGAGDECCPAHCRCGLDNKCEGIIDYCKDNQSDINCNIMGYSNEMWVHTNR